jgi:integrase/recombinase XerD
MGMQASTLAVHNDADDLEVWVAVGGFLAGYSSHTRLAYRQDLRQFIGWCHGQGLPVLATRRAHIELFARWLEHRGMARTTIARRLSTV